MNDSAAKLSRLQKTAWIAGGIFFLLTILGLITNPRTAYVSYLFSFLFWFSLTVGCLNVAMIHHLTGGEWGNVTRRFFEAGYMTLPVLAVLFIPLLFGLQELYPWANPAAVAADKILKQKTIYENVPGFTLRAAFFFAILIQIAALLRKWSLQQDFSHEISPVIKARTLSGPGVVVVPFVVTFAFIDWIMSIEPSWFSTIFAIILLAGGVLATLALGVMMLAWFRNEPAFKDTVTEKQFLDLGNLMLAFVMFWTYVAFSQLLVIYSGNQPHEIGWYLHRIAGGWKWLLAFIALFQFFTPFCILLFRSQKLNIDALARVAALVLAVSVLQNFWTVAPTFYSVALEIHWTDFTAWIAIGGIWFGNFAYVLNRHSLVVRTVMQTEPLNSRLSHEK